MMNKLYLQNDNGGYGILIQDTESRKMSPTTRNGGKAMNNNIENNTAEFIEVRELDFMPYDHTFCGESCHATGFEVLDRNGDWWYEFESADGTLYYGR